MVYSLPTGELIDYCPNVTNGELLSPLVAYMDGLVCRVVKMVDFDFVHQPNVIALLTPKFLYHA